MANPTSLQTPDAADLKTVLKDILNRVVRPKVRPQAGKINKIVLLDLLLDDPDAATATLDHLMTAAQYDAQIAGH